MSEASNASDFILHFNSDYLEITYKSEWPYVEIWNTWNIFFLWRIVFIWHIIFICVCFCHRDIRKLFILEAQSQLATSVRKVGKDLKDRQKNTSYLTIQHCWAMWKTPSVLFSCMLKTLKSNISWFLLSYPHRGLKKIYLSQTCWGLFFFFSSYFSVSKDFVHKKLQVCLSHVLSAVYVQTIVLVFLVV